MRSAPLASETLHWSCTAEPGASCAGAGIAQRSSVLPSAACAAAPAAHAPLIVPCTDKCAHMRTHTGKMKLVESVRHHGEVLKKYTLQNRHET